MESESQEMFDPDLTIGNDDLINMEMISDIERDLGESPYDMISLVFLLYKVPDTALQQLYIFQQISKDSGSYSNLNMLRAWYQSAKGNKTWKHEFVEALVICQLNSIVRKLGFNVSSAQRYYQPDTIATKMYINPMKKQLYKLCENMNSENLLKLRKKLHNSKEIDTIEYDTCELILLKLMCDKFIVIKEFQYNNKILGYKVQMDNLIRIVESLPGLKKIALDIASMQESLNGAIEPVTSISTSTPTVPLMVDETNTHDEVKKYHHNDFDELFKAMGAFHIDDDIICDTLKTDSKLLVPDAYEIKNQNRMGVCAIINQENFHRSTFSSNMRVHSNVLEKRIGSDKDQERLEKTMTDLNFDVKCEKDLDHREMLNFIKNVVKNDVQPDDSMFMLCILSHGVRGHVCAADSVKVNMDDIQRLLDSEDTAVLHDKPKLIVVQACQIEDQPILVADSVSNNGYKIKKSNFFVCWATAPELEAYRHINMGSIFIQILCKTIQEHARKEHVMDLFTKVIDNVSTVCTKLKCEQVPQFHSTLRKKLYLQIPLKI